MLASSTATRQRLSACGDSSIVCVLSGSPHLSMPSQSDRIILVGGFPEVIELAEECGKQIVGVIDPDPAAASHGYPVLGADSDAAAIRRQYPDVPVFVSVDEPDHRARLVELYTQQHGFRFATLIHPQAKLSRTATHGVGVMIQYGAHLSAHVRLDDYVRVNVSANVMHDVRVGRFTTIAPNAVILGRVTIRERCYIGAHSTLMPDVEIGEGACVGAQANVTKSVAPGAVVMGNPARAARG
jgi:sugar O-acyltransferase (sialic acid O-acetyltransferase NeuD family)